MCKPPRPHGTWGFFSLSEPIVPEPIAQQTAYQADEQDGDKKQQPFHKPAPGFVGDPVDALAQSLVSLAENQGQDQLKNIVRPTLLLS